MPSRRYWFSLALTAPLALATPGPAGRADDAKEEPGFKSLFNGKDLTGWRYGNEPLDGKAATADGRFRVKDGVLLIRGAKPGESRMAEIDTRASFDRDFVLRLEFRASPNANSGLHLRDHQFPHQLQIRDYPRAGPDPYKALKHYKDGDWNAIEVTVTTAPDGKSAVARCTCNGEILESVLPIPVKGPLGLQSEMNEVEYRKIRIKEPE